jgi:Lhr-like helicase
MNLKAIIRELRRERDRLDRTIKQLEELDRKRHGGTARKRRKKKAKAPALKLVVGGRTPEARKPG